MNYIVWKTKPGVAKVDENMKQVNNGPAEELKIKIELLDNENEFLRGERDNTEK